jgi:hypothetical protein
MRTEVRSVHLKSKTLLRTHNVDKNIIKIHINGVERWTGFTWLEIGTSSGILCSPSGCIKSGQILE